MFLFQIKNFKTSNNISNAWRANQKALASNNHEQLAFEGQSTLLNFIK